jgi:hypothetical protein
MDQFEPLTSYGKQELGPGSSMWDLSSIYGAHQEEEEPDVIKPSIKHTSRHEK